MLQLASLITYIIISQLSLATWIKLLIGATTFIVGYTTAAPLTGAINKTDIQNLKEMPKELGPLSRTLNIPLTIVEKTLRILQKRETR